MAGDWIKWTKGLHRKREVISMSARLNTSPAHVAGMCMILWEWLDENISSSQVDRNGSAVVTLGALQISFLDTLVGASGFAAAMSAEGWLNCRSGSLTVPNYARHNGQTAKDRALTAERVARHRGKGNSCAVTDVTVSPLPEKRREEDVESEITREPKCAVQDAVKHGSTLVPPADEGFCRSWWEEMESAGWTDRHNRPVMKWKMALSAAWRNACHRQHEMQFRGRGGNSKHDNDHAKPGRFGF